MTNFKMTTDFVLERLDVIGGSAYEKESGNETASRMRSFLKSHIDGNEAAILRALDTWCESEDSFKKWIAEYLINELKLKTHTEQPAAGDA
jgi:hypothetical protein